MNTDELAALTCDAVMGVLGDTATYHPIVGQVRTVRVFLRRPERVIAGFSDTRQVNDGRIIEIERAELSVDPQPGDKITVGGGEYKVRSAKPMSSAVAWELDCVPVKISRSR